MLMKANQEKIGWKWMDNWMDQVTSVSRNTIKDHIKALKRAGHLRQHGGGRGTWYGLD